MYWEKTNLEEICILLKKKSHTDCKCVYSISFPLKSNPNKFVEVCEIDIPVDNEKEFLKMFIVKENKIETIKYFMKNKIFPLFEKMLKVPREVTIKKNLIKIIKN